MNKIKYASIIYKSGVYISLVLIGISLIISAFTSEVTSHKLLKFDIYNLYHGIIALDPLLLLYSASFILIISPVAVIIYIMFYYFLMKQYGYFFISLFLILITICVIIFKTA